MAFCGKRMKDALSKKNAGVYSVADAVAFLKENSKCKFDETLEISMNLNVDPKKSDQNVRGMVALPGGTGKTVRVAVFARGPAADAAISAGADLVGAEDLAAKIQDGCLDFDVCIASPDMMGVVGRIAKILGPKGLMPNPKLGTVTQNVEAAIKAAKAGQAEYRADAQGIVHSGLGKLSFDNDALLANIKAFVQAVLRAKPAGVKGAYVKNVSLSTTMGVGLKLDLNEVLAL